MLNYNQDLAGDGLGNFHVGFSMDGAVTESYGVGSLFLGEHICRYFGINRYRW